MATLGSLGSFALQSHLSFHQDRHQASYQTPNLLGTPLARESPCNLILKRLNPDLVKANLLLHLVAQGDILDHPDLAQTRTLLQGRQVRMLSVTTLPVSMFRTRHRHRQNLLRVRPLCQHKL